MIQTTYKGPVHEVDWSTAFLKVLGFNNFTDEVVSIRVGVFQNTSREHPNYQMTKECLKSNDRPESEPFKTYFSKEVLAASGKDPFSCAEAYLLSLPEFKGGKQVSETTSTSTTSSTTTTTTK